MKKAFLCFIAVTLCGTSLFSAENYNSIIEKLTLNIPGASESRTYLGLKESTGRFTWADINADIIIIEIFSMYCPHCQKYAPTANKLYEIIQADPKASGKIKLIGIGIGNTAYEVDLFKKKYEIPFPLFDDENSSLLDSLIGISTPSFFAIRKSKDKAENFFFERGAHDDPEAFLKRVIEQSGMSL